jgi:hypothetical protein
MKYRVWIKEGRGQPRALACDNIDKASAERYLEEQRVKWSDEGVLVHAYANSLYGADCRSMLICPTPAEYLKQFPDLDFSQDEEEEALIAAAEALEATEAA